MAFQRPTMTQLRELARRDLLDAGLPGVKTLLRHSVLGVLTDVMAGLSWLHYGYLDFIARQSVPWTATDSWLESWGALKGVMRKRASKASASAQFSAVDGAEIKAGTRLQMLDIGDAIVTVGGVCKQGVIDVVCEALEAGAASNATKDTPISLSSPIAGVQSTGRLTSPATGGADMEDTESFRIRVMEAFSQIGNAGTASDYVRWALAVSGVTRAWVNPLGFGAGSVVVYIMLDVANASQRGLPIGSDGGASQESRYHHATGDQLRVADAIYDLRPITALVIVSAPEEQPTEFKINNLGRGNTPETHERIRRVLEEMFRTDSGPGVTIYPSSWLEALGSLGLAQYSIGTPIAPIHAKHVGAMPTLGHITFEA